MSVSALKCFSSGSVSIFLVDKLQLTANNVYFIDTAHVKMYRMGIIRIFPNQRSSVFFVSACVTVTLSFLMALIKFN
jgi:hypothetical protein